MINKQNIPDICTTLPQFSINNMLDSMVIYEESPRIDIDLNSIML